jgi:hypothetical protein
MLLLPFSVSQIASATVFITKQTDAQHFEALNESLFDVKVFL